MPCSTPALITAIIAANSSPATLELARRCTYNLTTPPFSWTNALPTITGTVVLVGGPSTAIRRDPAAGGMRMLEVARTGTLRIHGISILSGAPPAGEPGGAIQNSGALTLAQVTPSGHTTNTASGGALNNTGRAVVIRTTLISGNIADGVASGGGISNSRH